LLAELHDNITPSQSHNNGKHPFGIIASFDESETYQRGFIPIK